MTKITQLAAGDLSATSTDAVNGSQLYATNQNVTQNTSDISGLDTRVTINESELETNTNDIAVLDARVSDHDSAFAGMVEAFGGGAALLGGVKIGRASCRESVCHKEWISVVAG